MIHLALQTEYSFKQCYGPIDLVVETVAKQGAQAAGIADLNTTFGHVEWIEACRKYNIKPILGVRLNVCLDKENSPRFPSTSSIFIATNQESLEWIYELTSKAWDNFYYVPRVYWDDLREASNNGVEAVKIIYPTFPILNQMLAEDVGWIEQSGMHLGMFSEGFRPRIWPPSLIAIAKNKYPTIEDRETYQVMAGTTKRGASYITKFEDQTYPLHIQSEQECKRTFSDAEIKATHIIANMVQEFDIPKAPMAKWSGGQSIGSQCFDALHRLDLGDNIYTGRLGYELKLIEEKGYTDYFLIVADMIRFADALMLVGPARGSSAGSLVCYLLGITKIDPIKHGLLFERFIDINRHDLPDIDCDFPDKKRGLVIGYLERKYGKDKVRALANINTFKPKSAIREVSQALDIPPYETTKFKEAIIERGDGDPRADLCLADTFASTEPGRELVERYPSIRLAEKIEGHASHAGKHAAGIIVSSDKLTKYGSVNDRDGIIQLDKRQAESISLLKIDCLGLRTLSVIEEVLDDIGMPYEGMYRIELDDEETYGLFSAMRLTGVFQFEGHALQSLSRKMGVTCFDDIVAITALARPGAMTSGGAAKYVARRTGEEEPFYYNDTHKEITGETFGIVVYQEQMMKIAKEIGKLSWEDVTTLRKVTAKKLGEDEFNRFKESFLEGASESLTPELALQLWDDINTSGNYSFNKSHAVSYGLISYWTAYLKTHFPMQFAKASLNNAIDDEHAIKLLRDMVTNEGIQYVPVDADISDVHWSVHNDTLYGGLVNIVGIAEKKAKQIKSGKITAGLFNKLVDPKTPFDILFPADHYFGHLYRDPVSYGLPDKPKPIVEVQEKGEYLFLGKLTEMNLRDLNEYVFLKERDGEIIEDNNLYLTFVLEDDTDSIRCRIGRWEYEEIGIGIAEDGKIGESWYLVEGKITGDWRTIFVTEIVSIKDLKHD